MGNFSTPLALTQPLKCKNLGIQMPERDLAIVQIHDTEWHLWKESGSNGVFAITPFKVLNALSDTELETFYAQKFLGLQRIYAPDQVAVDKSAEVQDSPSPQPLLTADQATVEKPYLPQPSLPTPKPLPRASPTHHKSNIEWDKLAPRIIEQVVLHVAQEAGRPIFSRNAAEIRVGNTAVSALIRARLFLQF